MSYGASGPQKYHTPSSLRTVVMRPLAGQKRPLPKACVKKGGKR